MRVPDEPVVRIVKQWLIHADEDPCMADHAMTLRAGEAPYRLIAYHAQQCAEKCLKAFLVCYREEVAQAEASEAVDIARRVRNRVRTELKKLGVDLLEGAEKNNK